MLLMADDGVDASVAAARDLHPDGWPVTPTDAQSR
jgi:hypothetical protein